MAEHEVRVFVDDDPMPFAFADLLYSAHETCPRCVGEEPTREFGGSICRPGRKPWEESSRPT